MRERTEKGQQILDHMGSTELTANRFRATQTEDKLRRESKPSHTLDLYGHAMPGKDDEIANSIGDIYNLGDKKKELPITGRKIMKINNKRRTSN